MNKNVIIGVAGHVDHGKTSFVHCLTGIDTDRHPEEKRRGLSLDCGIAYLKNRTGRQPPLLMCQGIVIS